jgi:hypothetical protein
MPRLEDVWSSYLKGGVMPEKVWLFSLIVLAVLLEADLGRRKIGWFRVLRPLIASAAAIALFTTSVPVSGHNLALEAAGVGAGVLLGLALPGVIGLLAGSSLSLPEAAGVAACGLATFVAGSLAGAAAGGFSLPGACLVVIGGLAATLQGAATWWRAPGGWPSRAWTRPARPSPHCAPTRCPCPTRWPPWPPARAAPR